MGVYPITVDQLEDGHALILGTTGSGKTYQLRGMLEQLRRADRRVGAVDKLGNLWGLTIGADGQVPGLEFVIFGGKRAHVPMTPADGATLGRLFVERNLPAIFDVSQWKADEQEEWIAAFSDAVFSTNDGALHLAFDEVQSWVPQSGGGEAFRSVQRLAEQGRGNGIRLLLSCQRLSRLDATVRGMMHAVVAMRTPFIVDRKAVADLVARDRADLQLLEDLPNLRTGSGFLWEPTGRGLELIRFPANATFDSSRTPRHGDTPPAPIAVSSALVDELRAALAPPAEAGKPESQKSGYPNDSIPADPAAAYARGSEVGAMMKQRDDRIAELETQLSGARGDVARLAAAIETFNDRMGDVWRAWHAPIGAIMDAQNALFGTMSEARVRPIGRPAGPADETIFDWQDREQGGVAADSERTGPSPAATSRPEQADIDAAPDAPAGTDRELRALAGLAAIYPAGLTEAAWAARTGYSRKGGAWIRRRKRYLDSVWIEQRDGRWFATEAGVDAAGTEIPDMPPPGPALISWWAKRQGAPGRLLLVLADVHPRALTREALAAETSMAPKGGAFIRHVAALKAAELITDTKKRLAIAPALLEDGA